MTIRSDSVPCPYCHAAQGKPCIRVTGTKSGSPLVVFDKVTNTDKPDFHQARYNLAARESGQP